MWFPARIGRRLSRTSRRLRVVVEEWRSDGGTRRVWQRLWRPVSWLPDSRIAWARVWAVTIGPVCSVAGAHWSGSGSRSRCDNRSAVVGGPVRRPAASSTARGRLDRHAAAAAAVTEAVWCCARQCTMRVCAHVAPTKAYVRTRDTTHAYARARRCDLRPFAVAAVAVAGTDVAAAAPAVAPATAAAAVRARGTAPPLTGGQPSGAGAVARARSPWSSSAECVRIRARAVYCRTSAPAAQGGGTWRRAGRQRYQGLLQ